MKRPFFIALALVVLTVDARSYKRGVVTAGLRSCDDLAVLAPGISWFYTYGHSAGSLTDCARNLGLEFVPMQKNANTISTLRSEVPSGSKSLLGFNEPNAEAQSNLTPQEAADLWKNQVIPQLRGLNLRVGTPSAIQGRTPNAFDWFTEFFAACDGCEFDFMTTHYYGTQITLFQSYLTELNQQFHLPIWVTEFAQPHGRQNESALEIRYMNGVVSWMENTPWIERYAWFGMRVDPTNFLGPSASLLDNNHPVLTQVGRAYVNITARVPESTTVTSSTLTAATTSTTLLASSSSSIGVTSTTSKASKLATTSNRVTSTGSTQTTASASKAKASATTASRATTTKVSSSTSKVAATRATTTNKATTIAAAHSATGSGH